jgi:hypothetical protein
MSGAADHLVSEALYLDDPDGLGIEIYRDRPRDAWRVANGEPAMATDPLDLQSIYEEPAPRRRGTDSMPGRSWATCTCMCRTSTLRSRFTATGLVSIRSCAGIQAPSSSQPAVTTITSVSTRG